MKFKITLAFLLALILVFYFPFFRHHLVPVPLDIITGMYLPWLDKSIPVKNPLPSDVVSLTLPLRYLATNIMKSGQWPLWNPQIISGTPLMANFQSAVFNPLNLLYFLPIKFIDIWSAQIVLQPILAFIFFYIFISVFTKNIFSRLAGSTIWAFNGFFALWFQYNTVVYAALFLPLALFAIVKISKNYLWGFLISLALSISVFSGNPPVTMIIIGAACLFNIIYYWTQPKKILIAFFFIVLSLIYASPQLVPGLISSQNSIRNTDQVAQNSNIKYLPPSKLLTIFTPDFFGNPTTRNTWMGSSLYDNTTIYNGILAIILFFISIQINIYSKYKKISRFTYLLAIISFIVMLPNFFSKFLGSMNFLGLSSMVFSRFSLLWSFSLAVISSLTLSYLIENKIKLKKILPSLLLIILIPTTLFVISYLLNKYFSRLPFIDYDWLNQTKVAYRNCLYPILFSFSLVATFTVFFISKNKTLKNLCLIFILLINIFDLHRFFKKYNSFSPVNYFYPENEALNYLQKSSFRFARESAEIIPSNMWMMYSGLQTATGYDTTYNQNYSHFMSLINSGNLNQTNNRYLEIDNFNTPLINLLSIDHILVTKKDKYSLSDKGKISQNIKSANFQLIKDFGYYQILKNNHSLPFIRPIKKIIVTQDINKIQKLLLGPNYADIAIVNQDIPNSQLLNFDVQIIDIKNNSQSLSFKTHSSVSLPSFIVISQNYDSGWKLTVDDHPAILYQSNYAFSGIFLPLGDHQINLNYQPAYFNLSLWVSFTSILVSILTIIIVTIWKKRHN